MRAVFKFLQAPNPTGKLATPVLIIVSFYSDYNSEISSESVSREGLALKSKTFNFFSLPMLADTVERFKKDK